MNSSAAAPILVSTSYDFSEAHEARALEVADRIGGRYVRRRALNYERKQCGSEPWFYFVGRTREELRIGEHATFVHAGLFKYKVKDGLEGPLIRAVAPQASPRAPTRILDGTLGLAQDALHLTALLSEAHVLGVEKSAIVGCLLEDGLTRLRGAPLTARAAAQITLEIGDVQEHLEALTDAYDVILLDPMFDHPLRAAPGFDVFRAIAQPCAAPEVMLATAVEKARDRVVVKASAGSELPPFQSEGVAFNRRVAGRAFDYWIVEKAFPSRIISGPRPRRYPYRKQR